MEELQRRPGRPPKYVEAEVNEPTRLSARIRKPFGGLQQKLAYAERTGYHRHWFNDIPGRVTQAQEAGYEHVKDNEGKNVVRIVGTLESGGPMHAYLMEIPQEWYDQDMAAQQADRDEKMASIKRGDANRQDGDGRYIPKQGITIKEGR